MSLFWPTASMVISKGGEFNNDRGPNHSPRFHQGADIAIGTNTPIYGSGDGVVKAVINTGKTAGYGLYVLVAYGAVTVINSHMNREYVTVGQRVSVGTLLGDSGGIRGSFGAGDATGPHDHLEVRVNGALVNPAAVLASRTQISSGGGSTQLPEDDFMSGLSDNEQRQMYNALVQPTGDGGAYYKSDAIMNILRLEVEPAIAAVAAGGIAFPGASYNAFVAIVNAVRGASGQAPLDIDEAELAKQLSAIGDKNAAARQQELLTAIAANTNEVLAAIATVDEATLATFGLKRVTNT